MSVDIKIDGLDQLRNRLKSFANPEPIVKIALEKSGEHLRSTIQEFVNVRTGELQTAIIMEEVKALKTLIGPSNSGPAFRAHFLEYGTSKMRARPFMRPAFEQEKSKIEKIMAEELRKGLKL